MSMLKTSSATKRVATNLSQRGSLPTSALACLCLAATATLAVTNDASAAGRYTMSPSGDGFVRLDTETGLMSFCRKTDAAWDCQAMQDTSAKMTRELETLRRENAKLKERLASRTTVIPPDDSRPADGKAPDLGVPGLNLPSEQEVDRALGYFNRVFKKFRDSMQDLRDEAARSRSEAEPKPGQPL
ncbi:MAG: hypothetical protein AAFR70_07825 [Pseudomonadota bacterium]